MKKKIDEMIDRRRTIKAAKDELNFLRTYISNNELTNYLMNKPMFSENQGGKKSVHYINYDLQILKAINLKDKKKEQIDIRIAAILALDEPYDRILYWKYVEKQNDDEICTRENWSSATKKRRFREAYIQFASYLGITVYKTQEEIEKNEIKKSKSKNKLSEISIQNSQSGHETGHDEIYICYLDMLLNYCIKPRTRDQMQEYCKVGSRPYFSQFILQPMVEKGYLNMTIPDKPKSKRQRYFSANKPSDTS